MISSQVHYKDGAALAAIFSAALGCAVIGMATVLAEASPVAKEWLSWWPPAGPLTGKTGMGVIVWLASWLVFHLIWRNWELSFKKVMGWTLFFIFIGWLGTFPPIFELFAPH